MRLAIVGSTEFTNDSAEHLALQIIIHKIDIFQPRLVISGGAKGVDSLAKLAAQEVFQIDFEEFLPKHRRWAPEGFQERNDKIAARCTHLLAIRDHVRSKNNGWHPHGDNATFGSGYTAVQAEKNGAVVERIVL